MIQLTEEEAHEIVHALLDAAATLPQIHPVRGRVLNALALLQQRMEPEDDVRT